MHEINIPKDFSSTPGARYENDGPYSGEKFRENFLEPLFGETPETSKIHIILDGAEGYPTSFLEEAFGGIARKHGKEICKQRFVFTSDEDPLLIDEIQGYINDSN